MLIANINVYLIVVTTQLGNIAFVDYRALIPRTRGMLYQRCVTHVQNPLIAHLAHASLKISKRYVFQLIIRSKSSLFRNRGENG